MFLLLNLWKSELQTSGNFYIKPAWAPELLRFTGDIKLKLKA